MIVAVRIDQSQSNILILDCVICQFYNYNYLQLRLRNYGIGFRVKNVFVYKVQMFDAKHNRKLTQRLMNYRGQCRNSSSKILYKTIRDAYQIISGN